MQVSANISKRLAYEKIQADKEHYLPSGDCSRKRSCQAISQSHPSAQP